MALRRILPSLFPTKYSIRIIGSTHEIVASIIKQRHESHDITKILSIHINESIQENAWQRPKKHHMMCSIVYNSP